MFQTEFIEKIVTHFMFSNFFFNRAVYAIVWKNIVERDWTQMTIWRMGIVCFIPKATAICSEYTMLIAFTLQQRVHGRFSLLRSTYNACLSYSVNCRYVNGVKMKQ